MDHRNGKVRDYFSELYVAGRLADADWNVYFPHRDKGFDFIIVKKVGERMIVRPVQVEGKYPSGEKTNKATYGYVGRLSQMHPEMVLAIPYFSSDQADSTPICVAYIPRSLIKSHSRGYRCQPASFRNGRPIPRREHTIFFDSQGIERLGLADSSETLTS